MTMEIGKVIIVNLFGVYEPQGKSLQKTFNQIRNQVQYQNLLLSNRVKVDEAIKAADYCFGVGDEPAVMAARTHNMEVVPECIMPLRFIKALP
ncbi:hypothetical protein D3P08_23610 [Paenibacillus nanensis]|uniref:Uncharacterized protein n=1 Tax=Paenibacillus nanensis TaxID=393251 RepID=A0A3A1UTJ5_9BACL|nr:hypothetical protein [Paenibacillus nanensis]RIX48688.1 hypothetical protein D3P08_23610 [Paenibacillus nanensis]